METDLLGQVIEALLPIIVTLATAGVAWLGKSLNALISEKASGTKYQNHLFRLNEVVMTVVMEIQQTQVDALRAATSPDSPGGRRITADEAKALSGRALDRVKLYLGEPGIKVLMYVLGFEKDFRRFDDFLASTIEASVQRTKQGNAAPQLMIVKAGGVSDTMRPPPPAGSDLGLHPGGTTRRLP